MMEDNNLHKADVAEKSNTDEEVRFWVQCAVCKTQYANWVGSTPCCGSIAYLMDDGKPTKNITLFGSVDEGPIEPIVIAMNN